LSNPNHMSSHSTYELREISKCNMCGSNGDEHRVLGKRLNKSQGKNPWKKTGVSTTVCQCNNCGLVFSNPQPIPASIQDHYGIPPEEYWKEDYFKLDQKVFQGEISRLKKLSKIVPGMTCLDVGAGLGKQMLAMKEIGFDAYGLEPSEPFYQRAIDKMGIDAKKLKLAMVENAEYDDDFFDFISFGVVLEHLYDPAAAIEKTLKWLKPGGLIHIEVPSARWLTNALVNRYYKMRGSDYVANLSPMHEPFHLYEFDIRSFQNLSRKLNFKIEHHEYFVCKTYLPKVLDPFVIPYMRSTNRGMQLSVWLKKT